MISIALCRVFDLKFNRIHVAKVILKLGVIYCKVKRLSPSSGNKEKTKIIVICQRPKEMSQIIHQNQDTSTLDIYYRKDMV